MKYNLLNDRIANASATKTYAGAETRLNRVEALIEGCSALIIQREDGKWVPMVIMTNNSAHNLFSIANAGVFVTN